jgi:hypothetical protein
MSVDSNSLIIKPIITVALMLVKVYLGAGHPAILVLGGYVIAPQHTLKSNVFARLKCLQES